MNTHLSTALHNLDRDGWSFIKLFPHSDDRRFIDGPDAAYDFLTSPGRGKAPICGDRIELNKKDGSRCFIRIRDVDEVAAFDFFEGSGDPATVANPSLARHVKDLDAQGITLEPARFTDARGAWGGYCALTRGEEATLKVAGTALGTVKGTSTSEIDQALVDRKPLLDLYHDTLLVAAHAGQVPSAMLGPIIDVLLKDPGPQTLEQKAHRLLDLADAVREGPDRTQSATDQARKAIDAYRYVAAHPTDDAEWIIRGVGADALPDATLAIAETPSLATPIRLGLPPADAREADKHITTDRDRETLDRIATAARLQPGHPFLGDFLRAAQSEHPDAYATVLAALAQRGRAAEAPQAFSRIERTDAPDEAATRFATAFLLTDDLDGSLTLPTPAEAAPITRTQTQVTIAGITVPIRE